MSVRNHLGVTSKLIASKFKSSQMYLCSPLSHTMSHQALQVHISLKLESKRETHIVLF